MARVDPGHDPERFYHCDCIQGGYTPPSPCECEELRRELARTIRTMLYGTADQVWALKRLAELEGRK